MPAGWAHGDPLRVGDRVVFTGCEGAGRDTLEARSTELGVRVLGSVSSKTVMLVTDGTMLGGKHEKATTLGVRMVCPDTYRELLAHLQPAIPAPATSAPRGASPKTHAEPAATAKATASQPVAASSTAASNSTGSPSPALVRAWGRDNGWDVGQRGRLPAELRHACGSRALQAEKARVHATTLDEHVLRCMSLHDHSPDQNRLRAIPLVPRHRCCVVFKRR